MRNLVKSAKEWTAGGVPHECGDLGCSRPLGLPCRHPDKCFRSLESLGGDVALITKELFGFELLWPKDGKLPEYYMFVGALLY